MATEFSLESVRQYMLAHEGRVTNHDLVKHYKAWLTHPTEKESARQKFKEYVNTLSTIKVEDGVKFLVLKKRFFPTFADPSPQNVASTRGSSPSLLDEVMSSFQQQYQPPPPSHQHPPIVKRQLPPTPMMGQVPSGSQPPPPFYKAPPPPSYRQPPQPRGAPPMPPSQPPYHHTPSDFGLPLPADYGLPSMRQGVFHPPGPSSLLSYDADSMSRSQVTTKPSPQQYYPPPPLPRRNNESQMLSRSSSVMSTSSSSLHHLQQQHQMPPTAHHFDMGSRSTSRSTLLDEPDSVGLPLVPPPLPTRNNVAKEPSPSMSSSNASMTSNNSSRKASISEDKENASDLGSNLALEKEKISVKERTKTFNRMASEVEVTKLIKQSGELTILLFKISFCHVENTCVLYLSKYFNRYFAPQACPGTVIIMRAKNGRTQVVPIAALALIETI